MDIAVVIGWVPIGHDARGVWSCILGCVFVDIYLVGTGSDTLIRVGSEAGCSVFIGHEQYRLVWDVGVAGRRAECLQTMRLSRFYDECAS